MTSNFTIDVQNMKCTLTDPRRGNRPYFSTSKRKARYDNVCIVRTRKGGAENYKFGILLWIVGATGSKVVANWMPDFCTRKFISSLAGWFGHTGDIPVILRSRPLAESIYFGHTRRTSPAKMAMYIVGVSRESSYLVKLFFVLLRWGALFIHIGIKNTDALFWTSKTKRANLYQHPSLYFSAYSGRLCRFHFKSFSYLRSNGDHETEIAAQQATLYYCGTAISTTVKSNHSGKLTYIYRPSTNWVVRRATALCCLIIKISSFGD